MFHVAVQTVCCTSTLQSCWRCDNNIHPVDLPQALTALHLPQAITKLSQFNTASQEMIQTVQPSFSQSDIQRLSVVSKLKQPSAAQDCCLKLHCLLHFEATKRQVYKYRQILPSLHSAATRSSRISICSCIFFRTRLLSVDFRLYAIRNPMKMINRMTMPAMTPMRVGFERGPFSPAGDA